MHGLLGPVLIEEEEVAAATRGEEQVDEGQEPVGDLAAIHPTPCPCRHGGGDLLRRSDHIGGIEEQEVDGVVESVLQAAYEVRLDEGECDAVERGGLHRSARGCWVNVRRQRHHRRPSPLLPKETTKYPTQVYNGETCPTANLKGNERRGRGRGRRGREGGGGGGRGGGGGGGGEGEGEIERESVEEEEGVFAWLIHTLVSNYIIGCCTGSGSSSSSHISSSSSSSSSECVSHF